MFSNDSRTPDRLRLMLEQLSHWLSPLLTAAFSLLCLRFLYAATQQMGGEIMPAALLSIGIISLTLWRTRYALFAFIFFAPIAQGFGQSSFLLTPQLQSLLFSTLITLILFVVAIDLTSRSTFWGKNTYVLRQHRLTV